MEKPWVRAAAVVAILLLGGVWVALGKHAGPSGAAAGRDAPEATLAPVPAADAPSDAPAASVAVPWADKATDSTPLVRSAKEHPSPLGLAILKSLNSDKAVVLVCLPKGQAPNPKLLAWIKECSDYCKSLSTRMDIEDADPKEKGLLTFLKADTLQPPFLVGIALSGEVRGRLSGEMTRKKVIDLFAGVTGSCGVECENGCD